MSRSKLDSIITNLKTVYNGKPWYGTSVREILESIPHEVVHERPLPDVHSVFELISHMINWRMFVVRKILGEKDYSIKLNSGQDWTPNRQVNADEWKQILLALEEEQHQLLSLLEDKDDDFLQQVVPTKSNAGFNYEFLLNGIIHHDIYHLGQIALVKKVVMK